MRLSPETRTYARVWAITVGFVMLFQAAAAVEAFSNMLSHYRGIGWAVSSVLIASLITAAIATALLSGPDIRAIRELNLWIVPIVAARRVLSSILALFMIGGSWIFWSFHVPHRPNDQRHLSLLTILLGFYAAMYFAANADRKHLAIETAVLQVGVCLCLTAWLLMLRNSGEELPRSEIDSISAQAFRKQNEKALRILGAIKR